MQSWESPWSGVKTSKVLHLNTARRLLFFLAFQYISASCGCPPGAAGLKGRGLTFGGGGFFSSTALTGGGSGFSSRGGGASTTGGGTGGVSGSGTGKGTGNISGSGGGGGAAQAQGGALARAEVLPAQGGQQ
jgi:hypothetical protein